MKCASDPHKKREESGAAFLYRPVCKGTGSRAACIPGGESEGINILRPADAKEIPVEQRLFSEAWAILKAYRNIDAWGEEWGDVLDRVNGIRKEGKASPEAGILAEGLALSVLRYLDICVRKKTGRK